MRYSNTLRLRQVSLMNLSVRRTVPPVVIFVFAHVVRPHFSKQNKIRAKTMFAIGETVALAEWIIDDTCLVKNCFLFFEISYSGDSSKDDI